MGARLSRRLRPVALVLLMIGTLLGTPRIVSSAATSPVPVSALTGGSIWARAACLGCAALLFGAGGATIGGVVVEAMLFPDAFGGCGVICLRAFG